MWNLRFHRSCDLLEDAACAVPAVRPWQWGYHMPMARTQTMVQLTTELLEQLDAAAAKAGVSRSEVIRTSIAAYLDSDVEKQAETEWIAAHSNDCSNPDAIDSWGDLSAQTKRVSAATTVRLAQEESIKNGNGAW